MYIPTYYYRPPAQAAAKVVAMHKQFGEIGPAVIERVGWKRYKVVLLVVVVVVDVGA